MLEVTSPSTFTKPELRQMWLKYYTGDFKFTGWNTVEYQLMIYDTYDRLYQRFEEEFTVYVKV